MWYKNKGLLTWPYSCLKQLNKLLVRVTRRFRRGFVTSPQAQVLGYHVTHCSAVWVGTGIVAQSSALSLSVSICTNNSRTGSTVDWHHIRSFVCNTSFGWESFFSTSFYGFIILFSRCKTEQFITTIIFHTNFKPKITKLTISCFWF